MKRTLVAAVLMAAVAAPLLTPPAEACTRILYVGQDNIRIVGRSLDWSTPIPTNVYVYPRGMYKRGNDARNAVTWVSRYGAVYAVSYDCGVTEGLNEMGLVVNGLFCKGAEYGNAETASRAPISLSMFPAWILDMCKDTPEAVALIRAHDFNLVSAPFDGGTAATLHWGITDKQGRSAVIEFDKGNINIYEGQDLRVLTNLPTWPQMQAVEAYWAGVGGQNMLPGTSRSADRYVRGAFYDAHVKSVADPATAMAITRSLMANVSTPYTYAIEGLSSEATFTQWRSYSSLNDQRYYFEPVTDTGLHYIDLQKCLLDPGSPVLRLVTSQPRVMEAVGCANDLLEQCAPFTPAY